MSSPGPDKEAFVSGGARGSVVRNLDWPLVVEIGARVGVLTYQMESFTTIRGQGELAGSTTMTGLVDLMFALGWLGRQYRTICGRQSRTPESDLWRSKETTECVVVNMWSFP